MHEFCPVVWIVFYACSFACASMHYYSPEFPLCTFRRPKRYSWRPSHATVNGIFCLRCFHEPQKLPLVPFARTSKHAIAPLSIRISETLRPLHWPETKYV